MAVWAFFDTERGSSHGEVNGDDFTGASSYTPSHIVTQDRFAKKFALHLDAATLLREMWGIDFVVRYFAGLETLGGYYDAMWADFDPRPGWSSPALMARSGWNDGDGGATCSLDETRSKGSPIQDVKGSLPDPKAYHDASDPQTIVPHLRALRDRVALMRLSLEAKHEAVRRAAIIALGGKRD